MNVLVIHTKGIWMLYKVAEVHYSICYHNCTHNKALFPWCKHHTFLRIKNQEVQDFSRTEYNVLQKDFSRIQVTLV